jgi:hypothetical protein
MFDFFNDSDGTALATHDAKWINLSTTYVISGFEINSNIAEAINIWENSAGLYDNSQSDDQMSQAVYVGDASIDASSYRRLLVRGSEDSSFGYETYFSSMSGGNFTAMTLIKDDVWTDSVSGLSYPIADDHTIRISVSGQSTSTVKCYVDGTEEISFADSSFPILSGLPGFRCKGALLVLSTRYNNWTDDGDCNMYVDPDATGAGDGTNWTDAFTTLNAFDTNEEIDLQWAMLNMKAHCRASSGSADGTAVGIDLSSAGWNPGISNQLIIQVDEADRWKGALDTSKYRLDVNQNGATFEFLTSGGYCTVDGLQIFNSSTGYHGQQLNGGLAMNNLIFRNLFLKYTGSGSTSYRCLSLPNSGNDDIVVENCVFVGGNYCTYIWADSAANILMYNCIGYGGDYGLSTGYLDAVIVNCVSIGASTDGFGSGISGSRNNCSDHSLADCPGTNGKYTTQADSDLFVDVANDNFQVKDASSDLYQNGVGPATDSAVPAYDENEVARSGSTCEIGAFEFVAAGGGGVEIFRRRIGGY